MVGCTFLSLARQVVSPNTAMQTSTISALLGCSALLAACSSPNGAEVSEEPGAIHGTLRTFVVEGRGPNSGTHHQLRVAGSSQVLELKFPQAPGVVSGTPISVWGEATGNLLNVSRFKARAADTLAVARQPLTGQPVTYADTMVGVILNLNSAGTTTTTAAVQTWLLGTGAGPKMGMSSGNKLATIMGSCTLRQWTAERLPWQTTRRHAPPTSTATQSR